jgi:peptidoglycan/xylan/chitin deacetylase (PgdA/CDA1 family)
MKKIAFTLGMLLTLMPLARAAPVAAGGGKDTQLALFQSRTIFHSGLIHAHTIALTFDDGPNAHTEEVLDALKKLHVKATFFIVGHMAHTHPATLARIAAEGHLLGNHSAEHVFMGSSYDADPAKLLHQLRDVDDQIAPLMKQGDKLFYRAPYGAWKSAHAPILNDDPRLRNYIGPIYWDIGGDISISSDRYVMSAADWDCWHLKWSAQTCAKGYLREIRRKDGGVVLMHCINAQSAALVEAVVPALIEEGYNFVRLDQMPEYNQYETPGGGSAVATATPLAKVGMIRVSDIK